MHLISCCLRCGCAYKLFRDSKLDATGNEEKGPAIPAQSFMQKKRHADTQNLPPKQIGYIFYNTSLT